MTRHWTIVCVVRPVQQHQRPSVRGAADMANQPNPVTATCSCSLTPRLYPWGYREVAAQLFGRRLRDD